LAEQSGAARYLIVLFLASIVTSSAITFDYASNWFHEAAVIGSMESSVFLRWYNFSLTMPGNPNGTVTFVSELGLNNSANTDIHLLGITQRYYLIGYTYADKVGEYNGRATLIVPQGGIGVLRTVVATLYATKSGIYEYANTTRNWSWITHVSVTVASGDLSVLVCFIGSLQNAPNATSLGPELLPSSCNVPAPTEPGGMGG
jgi:hypothetical protein